MRASLDLHLRLGIIKEVAGAKAKKFLLRGGAYIRGIARRMVKHRSNPNISSKPGTPPNDHFGLRQSIIWASDAHEAVIGPRYIKGGQANAARIQEFGGEVQVKDIDPDKWAGFKVGQIGLVTADRAKSPNVVRKESGSDPKTGKDVVWIRIKSKKQAEHATRVYRRFMAANAKTVTAKYPARPYMLPALEKSLPHLPDLWKE